jgi:hypothetical protein
LPEVALDTRDNAPLIAAGGGLLLLISLFLSWIGEGSFWELYDIVDVLFALMALLAIVVGVGIYTGNTFNVPGGAGPAVYTAGLIAFSIAAFHLLEGEDRKIGIFIALIGTIGMIVGGLQLGRTPTAPRTRTAETTAPPPPPPPASPTV